MIFTGDNTIEIRLFKSDSQLGEKFKIKELGDLKYLGDGVESAKIKARYPLMPKKVCFGSLQETGKLGCRPESMLSMQIMD